MSSRSFRNNNPGNIRHHSTGPGSTIYPVVLQFQGVDDGDNYAHYPTVAKGCASLASLLASKYGDRTVSQMVAKYAPSDDANDPEKYTRTVCGWAGINPATITSTLTPDHFFDLCKAISRFEGWKS